jgi:hypothetical protein
MANILCKFNFEVTFLPQLARLWANAFNKTLSFLIQSLIAAAAPAAKSTYVDMYVCCALVVRTRGTVSACHQGDWRYGS